MSRANDQPVTDRDPMPTKEIGLIQPNLTVPFLKERAAVTLAADTAIGDTVVTLVGGHSVVVGETLEFADQADQSHFMQADVLIVATNDITLDTPANRIYLAASTDVVAATKEILTVGSLASPQIFSVKPLPTQAGHMTRCILEMRGDDTMTYERFGADVALTNGCVLRIKHGDGTYRNLFNFKSNSDFFEQGFDHNFLEPKSPLSTRGFVARVTWGGPGKQGSQIQIDGSVGDGEQLQLLVQDDLVTGSANTRFHLTAQGHEAAPLE